MYQKHSGSLFLKGFGSHLLSHAVSSVVPSAVSGLTIVFGMGTGVSLRRIATEIFHVLFMDTHNWTLTLILYFFFRFSWIDSVALQLTCSSFLRKEVIQPHLPIRLPCYDFTPVIGSTFDCSLPKVGSQASGISDSHGVTGGVYKTRERIHRDILIRDY